MSRDSSTTGYERGRRDAEAGRRPWQPGKPLHEADDGYLAYARSYSQGFADGARERATQQAVRPR